MRTRGRNIALIGCGAIAQAFYLPALARMRHEFGQLWLVDPSARARSAGASIVPGKEVRDLQDVDDEIHMVIVAAPNQLHYQLAQQAIALGADVLIEKPFVIWPDEGRALAKAAAAAERVIAINQTRRLHALAHELRRRIGEGDFGRLQSIVHYEGAKLTWPFESGAGFSRHAKRTGVIMDFGVHVIDFYQYLFASTWTLRAAVHDGFAGPEGLAEISLQADDAHVSLRLSRYHPQENVAHLTFENAEISFHVHDDANYTVRHSSGRTSTHTALHSGPTKSHAEALLLNFLGACEGRERPLCDAASSLPVIEVLDAIYRGAGRYPATLGSV